MASRAGTSLSRWQCGIQLLNLPANWPSVPRPPNGATVAGFAAKCMIRGPTCWEEWRGHAGLFSTADDLAIYTQMLLNQGEFRGKRILSPSTVRLMIAPRSVSDGWRALGWDVQTSFSSNRGELFPFGSFGHTGFTGTSIWIDPGSETALIFLSNRVHPQAKGNINRLRGQVATVVAASIAAPPFPKPPGETSVPFRGEKNLRKGTIK